jgi:hypothetical protein
MIGSKLYAATRRKIFMRLFTASSSPSIVIHVLEAEIAWRNFRWAFLVLSGAFRDVDASAMVHTTV